MSAVATNLVTVNPAFFQEIKEVNEELWKLLRNLRARLSAAGRETVVRQYSWESSGRALQQAMGALEPSVAHGER